MNSSLVRTKRREVGERGGGGQSGVGGPGEGRDSRDG